MSENNYNRERLDSDEVAVYRGNRYVQTPHWIFDVQFNPVFPISFKKFTLYLWRQTIGWGKDSDKLSARQIASEAGMRDVEVARWSHVYAGAGLIEYQPADYGDTRKDSSLYRLLPAIGDEAVVETFLRAVADVCQDSKYGPRGAVSAEVFASRVVARMEELRPAIAKR